MPAQLADAGVSKPKPNPESAGAAAQALSGAASAGQFTPGNGVAAGPALGGGLILVQDIAIGEPGPGDDSDGSEGAEAEWGGRRAPGGGPLLQPGEEMWGALAKNSFVEGLMELCHRQGEKLVRDACQHVRWKRAALEVQGEGARVRKHAMWDTWLLLTTAL